MFLSSPALDVFQHQHHLQHDRHIGSVSASRSLVELGRDAIDPKRTSPQCRFTPEFSLHCAEPVTVPPTAV